MTAATKKSSSPFLTLILAGSLAIIGISQSLLTTMSKRSDGTYAYKANSAVLMSEFCKLILSILLLLRQKQNGENPGMTLSKESFNYAVPAFLYAIHNNLVFVALLMIDPVTYELFNNMKIVTTSIVFRVMLDKKLRMSQWTGICLLLVAMAVVSLPDTQNSDAPNTGPKQYIFMGFVTMLFISLCSAFAGVYNELLIKKTTDSLYWTNLQLYTFSCSFCLIKFVFSGGLSSENGSFFEGFSALTWAVILVNGMAGQVISLIFKYGDNIIKCYASAAAVWGSAIMTAIFFGKVLTPAFYLGGIIVMTSFFLYFAPMNIVGMTDSEFLFFLKGKKEMNKKHRVGNSIQSCEKENLLRCDSKA